MKKLTNYLAVAAAMLLMASCNQGQNEVSKVPTTGEDSLSYIYGFAIAENLKQQDMNLDADMVKYGFEASNDSSGIMTKEEANQYLQKAFQSAQEKKTRVQGDKNMAAGQAYLESNKAKEGVQVTATGLQYEIVQEGNGPKPAATDKVTVHYHGTLIDGTVFDSSVDRGQPAQFPVNGVIPGWVEALQMMPKGSKWKLTIPSNLAYGERGPGNIGPNSVLIFDVELIDIEGSN